MQGCNPNQVAPQPVFATHQSIKEIKQTRRAGDQTKQDKT